MEASTRSIQPGRVIGEAFETYRNNASAVIMVAVAIFGGAALANGLLRATGNLVLAIVATIITLLAHVLYTGYVVKLVQDVRDGRRDETPGELLSAAAPYIGTLILNGILFGIAVTIGLALVIIPGLFLITIWAVVAPAIVIEDKGVIDAFGRSRDLVRGNGWNVFGVIVLAFLILVVFYIVAALIGAAIGDVGVVILSIIAGILAEPVVALVASILFFDLGGGQGVPTAPAGSGATPADPPPPADEPPPPQTPAA